jgi:uncharacterized Zn finger protein
MPPQCYVCGTYMIRLGVMDYRCPHCQPEASCTHNRMRERLGDKALAWECADCGYVYGATKTAVRGI